METVEGPEEVGAAETMTVAHSGEISKLSRDCLTSWLSQAALAHRQQNIHNTPTSGTSLK